MILAENVFLKNGYKANMNVMVLGVPGAGKTRNHVLPNLMDMDSYSFLVLDPKGEVHDIAANMLRKKGYKVSCINFDEPMKTTCFYNPLAHIHSEDDIIRMTELLMAEARRTSNDRFWPDSATILANALVSYLVNETNPEDRTLENMLKLLQQVDVRYTASGSESTLDSMFNRVKERDKYCFTVQQYEMLQGCAMADRTYASIVLTLIATFAKFMTKEVKYLTSKNTLDFKSMGHQKTALFIKSSDTDRSKDPLVAMLFQQAMDALCREADSQPDHRLPVHCHMFLDDFGTNLKLPRFDSYIAGMRSRELSCSIILQSEGQLRSLYGDAWSTILASCQSYIFLGSNDLDTALSISRRINRPLEEVLYKKSTDIFVFIQGEPPRKAHRYDLKQHRYYPLLNDSKVEYQSQR